MIRSKKKKKSCFFNINLWPPVFFLDKRLGFVFLWHCGTVAWSPPSPPTAWELSMVVSSLSSPLWDPSYSRWAWCHCVVVILWSVVSVWSCEGCVVKHGHKAPQLCDTPQARGYKDKNRTERHSNNQWSMNTWLRLYKSAHNEDTSHTQTSRTSRQTMVKGTWLFVVVFKRWCTFVKLGCVIQSPCQIIHWMVSKLCTDTLTEKGAYRLPVGRASVGAKCCWKTSLTPSWTLLCFFSATLLLLSCSKH